jgi:rhodanese-related sulfurtransferase
MLDRIVFAIIAGALSLPGLSWADTVKGRIAQVSEKANTPQLKVEDRQEVVRVGPSTQFVNAKDIKDLALEELIEVEFKPGEPATRITKVVFDLPPEQAIDLQTLSSLVEKGDTGAYLLADARPTDRYREGHIPTAVSIPAKELPNKLQALPRDKPVIFYCGGPTCPFTREALAITTKEGFTNVKGFNGGLPAWKRAKKPVHVSADWLTQGLDHSKVIIDVRPKESSSQAHIKTVVTMPASRFDELRKTFIKEKRPARLPGLTDRLAPIVLYADTPRDPRGAQGVPGTADMGLQERWYP